MVSILQPSNLAYVQAALAIRGFGIRGFDYSRFTFCYQNLLFAGLLHVVLIIRGFIIFFLTNLIFFTQIWQCFAFVSYFFSN